MGNHLAIKNLVTFSIDAIEKPRQTHQYIDKQLDDPVFSFALHL